MQDQLIELLSRIDQVPHSLVLVQAANESAWGTSRFARIGLNFFGIWCYREGCGMVPNGRTLGAKHEVQAFKTVDAAVARYLNNINTNKAYRVFRTIRSQLRTQQQPLSAEVLATGLLPYSQRGSDYVVELTNMIRHNRPYLQQSMQTNAAD
jgi:Bax protein